MLSFSFLDWYSARENVRLVRKWRDDWCARYPEKKSEAEMVNQWTMTHAMFYDMGGFRYVVDGQLESQDLSIPRVRHRLSSDVLYLAQIGKLSLSDLKLAIEDRSNADGLAKATVCIQILWFMIKCAARVQKHLPVTELEVSTIALVAVCATCYAFWWNKPLGVKTHIDLHITSAAANKMDVWKSDDLDLLRQSFYRENFDHWTRTILSLFGAIFGGIHCLAWNSDFPTPIERLLWRISALCISTLPPIGTFLYHNLSEHSLRESLWPVARFFFTCNSNWHGIYQRKRIGRKEYLDAAMVIAMIPMAVIYVGARLTLMVVAFTCLRSMPSSVHTNVDWTTYIPHV